MMLGMGPMMGQDPMMMGMDPQMMMDNMVMMGMDPMMATQIGMMDDPMMGMMQMGMDGIFVGSGIFKSSDPPTMADAIVMATAHYDEPGKVAEAMAMMEGIPMKGDELETLEIRMDQRGW